MLGFAGVFGGVAELGIVVDMNEGSGAAMAHEFDGCVGHRVVSGGTGDGMGAGAAHGVLLRDGGDVVLDNVADRLVGDRWVCTG